jgi:CheY-like chemotaxis protein
MHVDDEPEMREIVRQSLQLNPDLTVRSCASGEEALAVVRAWPPDLVLLDDVMPNMDGRATLAKLRLDRETAAIPVVVMTTNRHVGYFKALGASGVIAKPVAPDALIEAVHKFLRPKPSGSVASKKRFLKQAEAYAIELAACLKALSAGADHSDSLVQMRQIAHRLTDSEEISSYPVIGAHAAALDKALMEEGSCTEIQSAIDALLSRISAAVE